MAGKQGFWNLHKELFLKLYKEIQNSYQKVIVSDWRFDGDRNSFKWGRRFPYLDFGELRVMLLVDIYFDIRDIKIIITNPNTLEVAVPESSFTFKAVPHGSNTHPTSSDYNYLNFIYSNIFGGNPTKRNQYRDIYKSLVYISPSWAHMPLSMVPVVQKIQSSSDFLKEISSIRLETTFGRLIGTEREFISAPRMVRLFKIRAQDNGDLKATFKTSDIDKSYTETFNMGSRLKFKLSDQFFKAQLCRLSEKVFTVDFYGHYALI